MKKSSNFSGAPRLDSGGAARQRRHAAKVARGQSLELIRQAALIGHEPLPANPSIAELSASLNEARQYLRATTIVLNLLLEALNEGNLMRRE